MDDTADFTFSTSLDDSPEIFPDMNKITLQDSCLKDASIHKIGDNGELVQDDSLHKNENLKASGSRIFPSSNGNEMNMSKSSSGKALEQNGSVNQSHEKKFVTKKPAVRKKVPFEIGYSPMDWMKLTRTAPDLAGLKGKSNRRLISIDEVKQRKAEGCIWTVLKGRVYNITPYMKFHPGGVDMLMKAAGKDCTSLFNKYHAWVNDEFLLEKCLVGILDDSV